MMRAKVLQNRVQRNSIDDSDVDQQNLRYVPVEEAPRHHCRRVQIPLSIFHDMGL
jgi:hypothetical protein